MGGSEREKQGPAGGATRTLGDVLYADKSPPVPEQEWGALVQSVAAGDQRALHALYQRAHRLVYTLSVRITGSPETAEEVVLDVFHDVWRRASTYDPVNGTVLGWIMNQARSRAIDRLRLEQRKKRVNPHPGEPVEETVANAPYETFESWEERRRLQSALAELTPHEREAIEAAFFSELTHTEAAARLKEPLGTIKTRIRSALGKLRDTLKGKA